MKMKAASEDRSIIIYTAHTELRPSASFFLNRRKRAKVEGEKDDEEREGAHCLPSDVCGTDGGMPAGALCCAGAAGVEVEAGADGAEGAPALRGGGGG